MNNVTTQLCRTAREDKQRLRAEAVRRGIASTRMEGGDGGPEAQAIMKEWRRV